MYITPSTTRGVHSTRTPGTAQLRARTVHPGGTQTPDVVAIDLIQRGIVGRRLVAAVRPSSQPMRDGRTAWDRGSIPAAVPQNCLLLIRGCMR